MLRDLDREVRNQVPASSWAGKAPNRVGHARTPFRSWWRDGRIPVDVGVLHQAEDGDARCMASMKGSI